MEKNYIFRILVSICFSLTVLAVPLPPTPDNFCSGKKSI